MSNYDISGASRIQNATVSISYWHGVAVDIWRIM
jgi:hypothetical protein